jgi:hypothetical protein
MSFVIGFIAGAVCMILLGVALFVQEFNDVPAECPEATGGATTVGREEQLAPQQTSVSSQPMTAMEWMRLNDQKFNSKGEN